MPVLDNPNRRQRQSLQYKIIPVSVQITSCCRVPNKQCTCRHGFARTNASSAYEEVTGSVYGAQTLMKMSTSALRGDARVHVRASERAQGSRGYVCAHVYSVRMASTCLCASPTTSACVHWFASPQMRSSMSERVRTCTCLS